MARGTLREDVRESAICSMFVLLYDRDVTTRELAARMTIPVLSGGTVTGVQSAEEQLATALLFDQAGWADWLSLPEQAKVARSLFSAITPKVRGELEAASDHTALHFFESLGSDLARDKAMADTSHPRTGAQRRAS